MWSTVLFNSGVGRNTVKYIMDGLQNIAWSSKMYLKKLRNSFVSFTFPANINMLNGEKYQQNNNSWGPICSLGFVY